MASIFQREERVGLTAVWIDLSHIYINKVEKIPEGQEYAPRLEPAAPIHLADRNNAHYPSHRHTILKLKKSKIAYICIYRLAVFITGLPKVLLTFGGRN